MDLGNHSYSHLSLSATPVEAYIADVKRGETVSKTLLARRGRKEHWYRYPYLETGRTAETRRRFESWLKAKGYRVAPVTLENDDWEFADRYDEALSRGDRLRAEQVRQSYLTFTRSVVGWYRNAAADLLGRQPALIFLLHASRLNAACVDDLAQILSERVLHPAPLSEVMRDPAYRIKDSYLGGDGIEWLNRWSLTLHRDLPWDALPQVPSDIMGSPENAK